jgi:pyruvate/2-oxoglutarate dehydrogenase complex dihydrolipoamide acyltransferase (E2) component
MEGNTMKEMKLPALGEGIEKACVSYWHKSEGDRIAEGEEIVEMVTEKATFNVPSSVSGVLKEIVAHEGDEVPVGGTLARVE